MISFRKKKKELSVDERESCLIILKKIKENLIVSNMDAQVNVINNLLTLINHKNDKCFIKKINGIEMWGGSGAVWEIYIEDKDITKDFEANMIKLINELERIGILGKGIKPIRKIFKGNIK